MDSKKIPLGFCIPTHNRADYLEKTIKSIIDSDPSVEINISDNASEDKTIQIVKEIKKMYPGVKINFFRQKRNVGFDSNLLKSVELASSDYCWLISDDDLPHTGSISKIKSVITRLPRASLIHVNYSRFDNLLKKITARRMVGDITRDILFEDASVFFFKPITKSYFKFLGTNVITMSTNIVNRKQWLKSALKIEKFIGHNFIHCFVILSMIQKQPIIYYVSNPQIQYLANNHRVWPNDVWKDYNKVLLDYLFKLGYPMDEIEKMRQCQEKYERNEAIMNDPVYKHAYRLARPFLALARYFRDIVFG